MLHDDATIDYLSLSTAPSLVFSSSLPSSLSPSLSPFPSLSLFLSLPLLLYPSLSPFPAPSLSLSLSLPPSLSASLESFTPLVSCEELLSAWDSEGERERILQGLDAILEKEEDELEEADMFLDPVDLDEEPTYCTVVPFPTSVSTIAERMRNRFYRYKQE